MFKICLNTDITLFVGDPSCTEAYQWLHDILADTTNAWLSVDSDFNDRVKGNLGEFVAFHVTKHGFNFAGYYFFASNTDSPLSRISGAGLDLAYLFLGADPTGIDDVLIIQEVKTTGSSTLTYAKRLIADHQKLGSVDPSLNLQARVRALKARLRDIHNISDRAILDRVQALAHPDPAKCHKVTLRPTLVYERIGCDPLTTLRDVKEEIEKLGWHGSKILPVGIALSKVNSGFASLAMNKVFIP